MSDREDVYDETLERKIVFGLDASAVDVFGRQMIPNNGVGLSELVKNSYDADASIVEIHLGAAFEKDLDKTYVLIKDDGEGMSEEGVAKVFEEYEQAERSTSATHGGTGLGLPISKRFAELMGGGVTVSSEKGVGSVFSIYMPRICDESKELENQEKPVLAAEWITKAFVKP